MASHNRTIKLPRLRTKDELLKTSPELFGKLLLGDEMSTARSTAPPPSASQQPGSSKSQALQSAGRPASHRVPSRGGQLAATYDTPRGFGDEPMTIDQELAIELESVKRERQQLMESIAQVKAEAGTAGGEAQQADITQLLKELELKKAKLNELRGDSRKAEADIAKIRDDDTDARRLTPDGCVVENNYIQGLHDEMAQVDDDLLEADAKNRLYQLLGERTRQEHMALDQKVRDKQDSLRACMEDLANLTDHYNSVRAAKEMAQKELAKIKRQVEEARHDWTRKIREHRAEVNELQRRQCKDHEKEVRKREKLQEKEKAERAAQAKLKMEEEAYALQVAALAPKIEAMEASWNRLRAISGAETPEQVIEYWQGLQAKEARMRDLVSLAERREAACKDEISTLLASRSTMYEATQARRACSQPAQAAQAVSPAAVAGPEAEAAAQEAAQVEDEGCEETLEAAAAKIDEAEKRMEVAQTQFSKLRGICVAAEQGMRSLLQRLSLALEAPAHMTIGPPAQAAAVDAGQQASAGAQLGAAASSAGSRLTSAGGLSSISGSHGADGGLRRSGAGSLGGAGHQSRPSRDNGLDSVAQQVALASKEQRLNSSRARGHPEGPNAGASGGLPLVPEGSAGGRQRASQDSASAQGAAAAAAAAAASSSRAVLPSRGRNTIDDDSFFEGLPQLLTEVTDKLEKLLSAGQGLDLSAIAAAATAAGIISSGYSSEANTERSRRPRSGSCAGGGGGRTEPTPRTAAIKAMHAGLLPAAGEVQSSSDSASKAAASRSSQGSGSDVASSRASADAALRASNAGAEAVAAARASAAGSSAAEPADAAAAAAAAAPADGSAPAAEAAEGAQGEPPADDAAVDASTRPATAEGGDAAAEGAAPASASDADTAGQAEPAAESPAAAEAAAEDNLTAPAAQAPAAAEAAAEDNPTAPAADSSASTEAPEATPPAAAAAPAAEAAPTAAGDGAAAPAEAAPAAAVTPASAAASRVGTPGSFLATQSPVSASMVRTSATSSILMNEKALLKGLHRRTWVGAPWMDAVSDNPLDMNLVPSMKRKKGKKKEAAAGPDLTRILGYIPPGDVPAESESDGEGDTAGETGGVAGHDGVMDREYIKMRAAKITARHNAKAAAAAAAMGGR